MTDHRPDFEPRRKRVIECARCCRRREIEARNLCGSCYSHLLKCHPEDLANYPKRVPIYALKKMGPAIECARCEEVLPHYARQLCVKCWAWAYRNGHLKDYPLVDQTYVDEVTVERTVKWLRSIADLPRDERRRVQARTRPGELTRAERIEVLILTRDDVRRSTALDALGIPGRKYNEYAEAAGLPKTRARTTT